MKQRNLDSKNRFKIKIVFVTRNLKPSYKMKWDSKEVLTCCMV